LFEINRAKVQLSTKVMVNSSFNYAPAFPALLLVNKREFEETDFSRNAGTLEQTQYVPTEHFI
jgi:hypothetical protein